MHPLRLAGLTARFLPHGTRRDLARCIATVAMVGVLAPLTPEPDQALAGHHRTHKKRKKRCGAPGRQRLCARRCGPQTLCGKPVDCGPCPCATSADCVAAGTGDLCCANACVTGVCCAAAECANPTPACIGHACAPCTASEQCQHGQACEPPGTCCTPEGGACTSASFLACCSKTCDSLINGGSCASCRGRTCSATNPCCGGETCTGGYCGGCRDRATSCSSSSQCCRSDCVSGACLSALGGRCTYDVDCRKCYLNHLCTNACVGGVCQV